MAPREDTIFCGFG